MEHIIQRVVSLSLYGSVLVVFLLIMKQLLYRKFPKAFCYYIWVPVLLRFLLPFGYSVPLQEILPQQEITAPFSWVETIDGSENTQRVSENTEDFSINDVLSSPVEFAEVKGTVKSTVPADNVVRYMAIFWVLGAVGLLGWHIFSYLFFCQHLLQCASSLPESVDRRLLREYEDSRLKIVCSSYTSTPILIGLICPTVVIPCNAIDQCKTTEALLWVLRHETVHYKRGDILYKWAVVLTVCLHWFNPLVWIMRREINQVCELSCDEAVIRNRREAERMAYGNALLSFAATQSNLGMIMVATLSEGKKQLKSRLLHIKHYRSGGMAARIMTPILALLVIGCSGGVFAYTPGKNAVVAPTAELQEWIDHARSANEKALQQAGDHIDPKAVEYLDILSAKKDFPTIFQDYEINGDYVDADRIQFQRAVVNRQIQNLLRNAGIPDKAADGTLLTVDPYDYTISVSETNDAVGAAMERALNTDTNGKKLWQHIYLTALQDGANSKQITQEKETKHQAASQVMELTGKRLDQMLQRDDCFYTHDGENVLDLLDRGIEDQVPAEYQAQMRDWTHELIRQLAHDGWDNVPDMSLCSRWTVNGLVDQQQDIVYGGEAEIRDAVWYSTF